MERLDEFIEVIKNFFGEPEEVIDEINENNETGVEEIDVDVTEDTEFNVAEEVAEDVVETVDDAITESLDMRFASVYTQHETLKTQVEALAVAIEKIQENFSTISDQVNETTNAMSGVDTLDVLINRI